MRKQLLTQLTRWPLWLLLCLAIAWPTWSGCQVSAWVEAKEEIKLSLDIDALLKQGNIDKSKVFPGNKIPIDFKASFPFFHRQTYDLRNNSEVKKYKDQIRDIKVKALTYRIDVNSLSIDLPSQGKQLEVFVAKLGTLEKAKFAEVGYLFNVPHGRAGLTDRLYFKDGGQAKMDSLLGEFAIELGLSGLLAVDGSQSRIVPAGKLQLTVSLSVAFTVDIKL